MVRASPSLDNQTLEIINGVISALMTAGEDAAVAYLTALDPAILALPLCQWLLKEGIQYLGQIVSIAGQKFVDNLILDIQTKGEESDVIVATTALALAQASGNQGSIQQALQNAASAYKAAFNLDGWSPPQ